MEPETEVFDKKIHILSKSYLEWLPIPFSLKKVEFHRSLKLTNFCLNLNIYRILFLDQVLEQNFLANKTAVWSHDQLHFYYVSSYFTR